MRRDNLTVCKYCPTLIPKRQGFCHPCMAAWQRDRRARLKAEGKNGKKNGNGHHYAFGPGWLMPKSLPQIFATVSASIVWGICGSMADTPEY